MATSNIAYRINFSNQGRKGIAGSTDNFFTIAPLGTNVNQPTQLDAAGNQVAPKELSLTLTGYRNPVYGEALWTNLLQLLENFASPTKPTHPVLGQLWFDKNSELGALQLCTDPVNQVWSKVNNRIIVFSSTPSTPSPIPSLATQQDLTLWYDPTNRGLFFWDATLTTTSTTFTPPYNTMDPTGPTDATGHPTLHAQTGLTSGSKWVNVLYHRYASTTEYNSLTTQFAAWNMTGRPATLPAGRQPTDTEWLTLFAFVKQFGDTLVPSVDTSTLVPTTFKYYSTDRFGFSLLQQYYDTLVSVCTAIFTQLAINQTPVPIAAFATSVTSGAVPMPVIFADTSVHASGATYLWNFGDGTTSSVAGSVSHTYQSAGSYTTVLTVTSISGTSTTSHTVRAFAAPVANFTRTPATGTTPLTVAFTDNSTNTPTSWLWDFGDGVTSALQNPTHMYTTVGTFTTTLVVTNAAGSNTTSQPTTVSAPVLITTPVASFTRSPLSGATPLTVTFTDTSANTPTTWLWNFGDGTTATTQNTSHTYTTAGTYTATLTATNSAGSHSTSQNISVTIPAVVSSFTVSSSSALTSTVVAFTDTSTNTPTAWLWNFGDGATSTLQNPTHAFSAAGTYQVTLTATNTSGGTASAPTTMFVTANVVTITINSAVSNFNVYNNLTTSQHGAAVTISGTYAAGSVVNVNVNSGVVVGSTSIAVPAFSTGSAWSASDTITLTNNGMIVGKGGNANGGAGGLALQAQRAIVITNNSIIGGGGGGGGMGAYMYGTAPSGKTTVSGYAGGGGGGGGAGSAVGTGGSVNGGNSGSVGISGSRPSSPYSDNPSPGAPGTVNAGGAVGPIYGYGGVCYIGAYATSYVLYGGNGGVGGALGAAGAPGAVGGQGGSLSTVSVAAAATAGGAPGAATSGNTYITWTTAGTRLGTLG